MHTQLTSSRQARRLSQPSEGLSGRMMKSLAIRTTPSGLRALEGHVRGKLDALTAQSVIRQVESDQTTLMEHSGQTQMESTDHRGR